MEQGEGEEMVYGNNERTSGIELSSDGKRVLLYPRRKGDARGDARSDAPQRGRKPVSLELATVEAKFDLPQPEAAMELGISLTSLKLVCRKLGLKKWPYRRPGKSHPAPKKEAKDETGTALNVAARHTPSEVEAAALLAAMLQAHAATRHSDHSGSSLYAMGSPALLHPARRPSLALQALQPVLPDETKFALHFDSSVVTFVFVLVECLIFCCSFQNDHVVLFRAVLQKKKDRTELFLPACFRLFVCVCFRSLFFTVHCVYASSDMFFRGTKHF